MAITFEDILPWGTTGGDTGLSARLKLKRNFEKIRLWTDAAPGQYQPAGSYVETEGDRMTGSLLMDNCQLQFGTIQTYIENSSDKLKLHGKEGILLDGGTSVNGNVTVGSGNAYKVTVINGQETQTHDILKYDPDAGHGVDVNHWFVGQGAPGVFRSSALKRYDGTTAHTIWDAGNDGSESGLDADLLDGHHANYFATASSLNNVSADDNALAIGNEDYVVTRLKIANGVLTYERHPIVIPENLGDLNDDLGVVTTNILESYFDSDGAAKAAVKLKTARTIWGQSFDGTGNVTGAMTDVTAIDGLVNFDTANGYVGIGVASPLYKLDVSGVIKASDGVIARDANGNRAGIGPTSFMMGVGTGTSARSATVMDFEYNGNLDWQAAKVKFTDRPQVATGYDYTNNVNTYTNVALESDLSSYATKSNVGTVMTGIDFHSSGDMIVYKKDVVNGIPGQGTRVQTPYALASQMSGYLPLTAGSSNPLTGDLYISSNKDVFFGEGSALRMTDGDGDDRQALRCSGKTLRIGYGFRRNHCSTEIYGGDYIMLYFGDYTKIEISPTEIHTPLNVAIGTGNPTAQLHVFGDARITSSLFVDDDLYVDEGKGIVFDTDSAIRHGYSTDSSSFDGLIIDGNNGVSLRYGHSQKIWIRSNGADVYGSLTVHGSNSSTVGVTNGTLTASAQVTTPKLTFDDPNPYPSQIWLTSEQSTSGSSSTSPVIEYIANGDAARHIFRKRGNSGDALADVHTSGIVFGNYTDSDKLYVQNGHLYFNNSQII